jgi:hypothetical protein
MKKCLHCDKDFENKKDTTKFCSTSCRVMYHRKNKDKPKGLTPEQRLTVVYNKILDVLSKTVVSGEIKDVVTSTVNYNQNAITTPTLTLNRPFKSVQQYISDKREIESEEIYRKFLIEVENDPNLSSKQKQLIKTS